jgi:GNAT superfamily N-acetyltransferase
MDIRRLGQGDERALEDVGPCFDGPVRNEAATRFLQTEGHHIFVAYDGGRVAGFVTGIEMTHPDKGTEMFLYELSVHEGFRRRGYGTALVEALAVIARERGCYGMWVLTDDDNEAALATYGAAGATRESTPVMLSWQFSVVTRARDGGSGRAGDGATGLQRGHDRGNDGREHASDSSGAEQIGSDDVWRHG